MHASRDGRPGRTLAEMLVVLVLVGLMATAAAPALRGAREERGAALVVEELAARLERARATAARTGTSVTLVLDPASGHTWRGDGDDAPLRAEPVLPLRAADGTLVAIAAPRPRMRWVFLPAGGAWGAEVVVRDRAHAWSVSVDPVTGAPHAVPR